VEGKREHGLFSAQAVCSKKGLTVYIFRSKFIKKSAIKSFDGKKYIYGMVLLLFLLKLYNHFCIWVANSLLFSLVFYSKKKATSNK